MITVDQSAIINRPPDEVFAFMTNPANIPKWRSDVTEVLDFDSTVKAGATFREAVKGFGKFTMRIKEYTPSTKEVIETIAGPKVRPTQTYTFVPTAAGTEVKVQIHVEVGGVFKVLQPILPGMIKKNWSKYLARLKHQLENR